MHFLIIIVFSIDAMFLTNVSKDKKLNNYYN